MRRPVVYARLRTAGTLAAAVLLFDQLSKAWVRSYLPLGSADRQVIPGFLALTHRLNPGVAFSLFRSLDYAPLIFSLVALAALGFIAWILARSRYLPRSAVLALGAIAGGACGNLVDRIRPPHHVLDFVDCYFGNYHWPAFNVADSAICIGAALLLVTSIIDARLPGSAPSAPPAPGSPGSQP